VSTAIFISPHLDDAVLSCGGGIAHLIGSGERVTVVTVFTGDQRPGEPLSVLAVRSHASWAAGDQPFAARGAEDLEALGSLGATAEHLGLLDAIYRRSPSGRPLYANPLGMPASEDLERFLPQIIAALNDSALAAHPDARVFCPAGTGGHVDHVLTRQAVEQVVNRDAIVYYDEYPYVTRPGVEATRTAANDGLAEHTLSLTSEELAARISAASCYESQLRGLFPSRGERLREIASARLPLVGGSLSSPPNVPASRGRMAARITRDVGVLGGEPYRWPASCSSPFPQA